MPESLSKAGKWLLGAAFLAAPLTTLRPIGSVTLGDVFLALAFLLALVVLVFKRRLPPLPRYVWIGTAVLLVSIGITVVAPPGSVAALIEYFGQSPYGSSLSAGMRLMIALVALPVAVALIVDRWSTISFLTSAWIIGATASSLVAVVDAFTGSSVQEVFADNPELLSIFQNGVPPRFMGLSVHPTSFSITAAMALPLVLARMDAPRTALFYSPVALVLIFGVVLSGSRVGVLGVAAVALIYVCVSANLRRVIFRSGWPTFLLAAAVAGASVFLFYLGPPVDPAGETWQETISVEQEAPSESEPDPAPRPETGTANRFDPSVLGSDKSSKERMDRFKNSVDLIVERPLAGYGFEWIETSHSIYLQLLVSGGILALIGFLVVFWGYAKAWYLARRRVPEGYRELMLAFAVSTVGYLLMGAAQTDLLDRYVYLPAGLILAAYALSLSAPVRSDEHADSDQPK